MDKSKMAQEQQKTPHSSISVTFRKRMKYGVRISCLAFCSLLTLWWSACAHKHNRVQTPFFPETWQTVRTGKSFGISGMALFEHKEDALRFLIVHDNEGSEHGRIAIVTVKKGTCTQYKPLIWPESVEPPVDLEALASVPVNDPLSFMALTSKGTIYHLTINPGDYSIAIPKVFSLPATGKGNNFEGLALHRIGKKLLAVWAHRGGDNEPGVMYWGWLQLHNYRFSVLGSSPLKVPWPTRPQVRHITDIKITSEGLAIVTSASDPGDSGPFHSAAYTAGWFRPHKGTIAFQPVSQGAPLFSFHDHKVEALELVPGSCRGVAFATDDEHCGTSVRLYCPCSLDHLKNDAFLKSHQK